MLIYINLYITSLLYLSLSRFYLHLLFYITLFNARPILLFNILNLYFASSLGFNRSKGPYLFTPRLLHL